MIYELSREVSEEMRRRKYPYHVQYGPEYATRDANGSNGIVMLRSARPDTLEAPAARRGNPVYRAVRVMAVDAWVYARANVIGADRQDHEFECETTVDLLTTALYDVIKTRGEGIRFIGGSYLTPSELEITNLTTWNGVVYVMQFGVQRGVVAKDYTGAARPEATLAGIENTTNVLSLGLDDGTACDATEEP